MIKKKTTSKTEPKPTAEQSAKLPKTPVVETDEELDAELQEFMEAIEEANKVAAERKKAENAVKKPAPKPKKPVKIPEIAKAETPEQEETPSEEAQVAPTPILEEPEVAETETPTETTPLVKPALDEPVEAKSEEVQHKKPTQAKADRNRKTMRQTYGYDMMGIIYDY